MKRFCRGSWRSASERPCYPRIVLFLKEQEVRELLPMKQAVELMRVMFGELRTNAAKNQPRRRMYLPTASVLHSMAGACGKYYGTKIYSANARARNAEFLFWLLDAATAKPLALMEANWLGQIRTGAASGYATDLLASKSADRMGVIGSGFQARSQVEAVAQVRELKEVRVWSRQAENRDRFAEEIRKSLGIATVVAASAEDAVSGMPIVTTATWSKDPVVEAAWISPGAVVNAMGSNNPERRELPADLIARAGRIVVDSIEVARIESGDLLLAWKPEDWSTPRLMELKDLDAGVRPADEVAIFKSNGLGVEDVAVGGWVYEQALSRGAGSQI
jgi:alanine dehydrogenase